MSLLRFDSIGGASGDMILAALVDAGAKAAALRGPLATLPVHGWDLRARRVTVDGHTGTRVRVDLHEHEHHPHRTCRTIRSMIRRSRLPAPVKALSIAVFENLALAEGRVHHMPPDDVHFHEVGAVDSIIDIVGACLALDELGINAVSVGPLPYGSGSITCAHGVIPVPAPATVNLLKGHPLVRTDEPYELVTPTGAALLMTWQQVLPAPSPDAGLWAITAAGTGFGTRTLTSRPNMLRAVLMESIQPDQALHDECLVLECNLDDTTPEIIGALTQRLLAAGALDVFTTSIQMKKQRPGVLFTVLCHPGLRDHALDLIFRESTTFGVREHLTRRTMLERHLVKVQTPYGLVRVKVGTWKGRTVTHSPEYDDCLRLAGAHGVPVRAVYAAAQRA